MASIRSTIELQDNFSGILNSIINSVNIALSTMEDMQRTMGMPVDHNAFDGARDAINNATMAVRDFEDAVQSARDSAAVPLPEPSASIPTPDPVSVPVEWNTNGLEVFTGTGIERFRQEVQSTNVMLDRLSSTQNVVARQAYNTSIFPPDAANNMNSLAVRIDTIRDKIQEIENNPINMGTDEANTQLENLRGQLSQAINIQNELNAAVDDLDVSAANDAYNRLSQTVSNTERYIRDNVDEQGIFNRQIQQGVEQSDSLISSIKKISGAYITVQSVFSVLHTSDDITLTTARLNMMNDGLQTTDELTQMIFRSAQNARGSFSEIANVVARFGNNAKDAFSSTEEVVKFSELVQKQMIIAGASTNEASNAMLQLSQALGSGVLRGDELNSIFEQAPNLIQSIADYLNVPIGRIRKMASEGEISADIVKAAIFASANEINEKFESMPKTFGQIWQSIQNTALISFQPILDKLNEIANSERFQIMVQGVIDALAILSIITLDLVNAMISGAQFVSENWSMISPIIYGIIGALSVYAVYLGIVKALEIASAAIKGAIAVAEGIHALAIWATTSATWAETTAQLGLNAAMYACPVVWIIIMIIALIAVFYAAVAAVNKFAGTSVSATGVICGVFSVAAAFVGNLFVTLINFVIDLFVVLWNFIAAFANFFANVFDDPVGAIARLFFDLVDTVLSLLQSLASAIDTIFGSSLSSSVQGWRNSLSGWVDSTYGKGTEVMEQLSAEDMHLGRFEYGAAWDAGYSFGEGIDKSIENFDPSSLFNVTDIPSAKDYLPTGTELGNSVGADDNIGSDIGDIAKNTSDMANSAELTEEDLKYLRDIAEQETINRFTTAEIHIDMSGMQNNISSDNDLDGIISGLTEAVDEAVAMSAEGVYA